MAKKSADGKFCNNRDYGNIHIKLAFGLFIASVAIQGIEFGVDLGQTDCLFVVSIFKGLH